MKLYDQIFNVVKDFRKFFSPGPVTNIIDCFISVDMFIIETCSYIAFRACYFDCSCCFNKEYAINS